MSFYQVSSDELRNSSSGLLELNSKLKTQKETLTTDEQNLLTMWEGEAQAGFHQAFLRDIGQMEAFIAVIDSYAKVMESIALRYENAETNNLGIANTRIY